MKNLPFTQQNVKYILKTIQIRTGSMYRSVEQVIHYFGLPYDEFKPTELSKKIKTGLGSASEEMIVDAIFETAKPYLK